MNRLADLAATHQEIRAALDEWLAAVASGERAAAARAWTNFAAPLRAHAAMEEEMLLPLFCALGLESAGCSAAILRHEHAKILRLLAATEAKLDALAPAIPPAQRVALILDAHPLLQLLEHHDQRERAGFFPALDAALDPAQGAALYASCVRSQSSAAARESRPPSSCNS